MAPICCGWDVLPGEQCMGLGYLLPTLSIMKLQLQEILDRNTPLTICQPLVRALLNGLEARFGDIFGDTRARLAAVFHPKFKLDWLDNHIHKIELTEALKRAIIAEQSQSESQSVSTEPHTVQSAPPTSAGSDFFSTITARRMQNVTRPDADSEVEKYLGDSSSELSLLHSYPTIRKLFLKLNTGLPSSAAVERLFSLGG